MSVRGTNRARDGGWSAVASPAPTGLSAIAIAAIVKTREGLFGVSA